MGIKIIKQEKFDGEILDTYIEIKDSLTIEGCEYNNFKNEYQELIDKYRI